jgi:hypothetical protein
MARSFTYEWVYKMCLWQDSDKINQALTSPEGIKSTDLSQVLNSNRISLSIRIEESINH